MERIILFRFHRELSVCKSRIEMLKELNPGIKIYGIFGGDNNDFPKVRDELSNCLDHVYRIPVDDPKWKWKNGDLALRLWYQDYGKDLSFDVLHMIEWDMLLLDSLPNIYKKIPIDGIGITALTDLEKIEKRWDWTSKEPSRSEWLKLLGIARDNFGYNKRPCASLGAGPCMPKSFLEKYSELDVPELCHDELRLPLFGQILGFNLYDTGFYTKWFDAEEERAFNAAGREVDLELIRKEIAKPKGRRVFHPCSKVIDMHRLLMSHAP